MLPYLIYKRGISEPLARLRNHTKINPIQMFENWGQDLVSEAENFCHLRDIWTLLSKRKWNARPYHLHRFNCSQQNTCEGWKCQSVNNASTHAHILDPVPRTTQMKQFIIRTFEKVLRIQVVFLPFFWSWCHNKARRCKRTTTSWLNVGVFEDDSLRTAGKLDNDVMNKSSPLPYTAMSVSRPLVHLNVLFPV